MTDEMTSGGISLFGYIILFVIIVWVFGGCFGGNFGGFGRGNCGGFAYDAVGGMPFQDYKAIVQSEMQDISRTATTQYLIEQQAANTREVVTAQSNAIQTKIDFYEYQKLRDTVSDRDRTIAQLQNELFTKDQLAPITAQLNNIQANMLVRPNVTGVGVACPSAAILNGLGVNSVNNCCHNNCCNSGTLL